MIIWQGRYTDPDHGVCLVWAASKRQAMRETKAAVADSDGRAFMSVGRLVIPRHKDEFIRWLNAWVNTDNG